MAKISSIINHVKKKWFTLTKNFSDYLKTGHFSHFAFRCIIGADAVHKMIRKKNKRKARAKTGFYFRGNPAKICINNFSHMRPSLGTHIFLGAVLQLGKCDRKTLCRVLERLWWPLKNGLEKVYVYLNRLHGIKEDQLMTVFVCHHQPK